jgi:cytochrome c oxidase subunit II
VKGHIRKVVILWAVITVALIAFAFLIPGMMPSAASNDQHAVRLTMVVFTITSAPVIALVVAIAIYSLIAWRSGSGDPPIEEGPPIRENGPILTTWIAVSSVLVLFLLVWGFAQVQASTANAAPGAMTVNVTGQQWIWSFEYPNSTESNRLVLPVNKPVILHITSEDVVHGFWIPNFGVKADANPGETTQIVVTPTTMGTFPIRCAELCGLYHAYMDATVSVVSQSDFDAWVASGRVPASPSAPTSG